MAEALDRLARPLVDVPVLVDDTGLDLDHPDIAPRLIAPAPGSDLIGDPPPCMKAPGMEVPDSDPSDPAGCSGHGTAVAGILGAAWNNGVGGAGVAPNALFIPIRYCWDDDTCYQYNDAAAFDRAISSGARVVSMSWLIGASVEQGFRDAIAGHPNTLFVAIPSGNGGATDADPDAANRQPCALDLPNVLCVSTSSPTDGLDCGDYGATLVDVAVPTQNSVTTVNGGGFGPTGCATSYAAPTAAGLATILFGLVPEAAAADVKQAIIAGARPVPDWQGKSVSGGIADAVGAVDHLQAQFGLSPPGGGQQCFGEPATMVGTEGADTLRATNGPDVVVSLGGDDVVRGLRGNDLACGGDGADKVVAGSGKDKADGGPGRDKLIGGKGNDRLVGGDDKDKCIGGSGHDHANGCERSPGVP
ncbi:MAG TPA: S8 family serine peptidase [Solirubrobacterales bacterium]|nr:S8 family serine peptidase [Solirubrobacterales bacterium]